MVMVIVMMVMMLWWWWTACVKLGGVGPIRWWVCGFPVNGMTATVQLADVDATSTITITRSIILTGITSPQHYLRSSAFYSHCVPSCPVIRSRHLYSGGMLDVFQCMLCIEEQCEARCVLKFQIIVTEDHVRKEHYAHVFLPAVVWGVIVSGAYVWLRCIRWNLEMQFALMRANEIALHTSVTYLSMSSVASIGFFCAVIVQPCIDIPSGFLSLVCSAILQLVEWMICMLDDVWKVKCS